MHLILRQLLSWELYCYPILLIHFESLDTYLLPHRLFLKVLSHSTDVTNRSVKSQCVFHFMCIYHQSDLFLSVWMVFWKDGIGKWHSGIPVGRGLHGPFESLICKAWSSNSRASLWPRTFPSSALSSTRQVLNSAWKSTWKTKEILFFSL